MVQRSNSCTHEPDPASIRPADGAGRNRGTDWIVDVLCGKCGASGSTMIDVNSIEFDDAPEAGVNEIWVVEHSWYGVFGFAKRADAITSLSQTTGLSVTDIERQLSETVDEVEVVDAENVWNLFHLYAIYMNDGPVSLGEFTPRT